MTFGEKLRKYRTEKGLTQAELAKAAGLGLKTITNYESGATYPKSREVYKTLANILGVDADHLHNENDDFMSDVTAQYGSRGAKQAKELLEEVTGLFAGGEMADEDMREMVDAIQEAYLIAKKNNKKYTPKKLLKDKD